MRAGPARRSKRPRSSRRGPARSAFEQSIERCVERRGAFAFTEDECLDARPVCCRTHRGGQAGVPELPRGRGPQCTQPPSEAPAKLGVASCGTHELEEQQRELTIKRHRLRRGRIRRLTRLGDPRRVLLVKQRQKETLLGPEVVIERTLRTAGPLADAFCRGRVIAALCKGAPCGSHQPRPRVRPPFGLRSTTHIYTIRYISTNAYESVAMAQTGTTIESPGIGQTI